MSKVTLTKYDSKYLNIGVVALEPGLTAAPHTEPPSCRACEEATSWQYWRTVSRNRRGEKPCRMKDRFLSHIQPAKFNGTPSCSHTP